MDSKNTIAAIALSSAVIVLYSLFFIPEKSTTGQNLVEKEITYLYENIVEESLKVERSVKRITKSKELLDSNKILKNTLAIRDTYLDPLSLIQVFLLQKLQNNELTDYEKTSLLLSVNGLAAGLRNTG